VAASTGASTKMVRTVLITDGYRREIGSHSQLPPAVSAQALTLAHGDRMALDRASFVFPAGQVTALVGPNGSGKSTLLDAVAGLHHPVSGRLVVLGGDPPREAIAYVLQHLDADDRLPLSVREVVAMGRWAHLGPWRRLGRADRAAVDQAMDRLAITDLARRPLARLSGGQRQRALVAQALAQQARLLLLDEPVGGLDLPSQERIEQVVAEEREAGRTVVISTHSLAEAAEADHVLLLAGRVVAQGPPEEVLVEANLREAYGARVVDVGTSALMIDDGSHHRH